MRAFDHIGVPTEQKQPEEFYVEATKVWITDPLRSAQKIEYLRFEPDSPVTGPVRDLAHIAYRVDNLEREMNGAEVLLGPFQPVHNVRVVFVRQDGAVVELMEDASGGHWYPQT